MFEGNYLFFLDTAPVEFIRVLVVMYTFNDWWRPGRALVYSPLEMANAFEASMLMHVNSNADADDITKAVGG